MGRAELPRDAPSARAVKASNPWVLTMFKAASMICSFVNFAFGGMSYLILSKTHVLHRLFCYNPAGKKVNRRQRKISAAY